MHWKAWIVNCSRKTQWARWLESVNCIFREGSCCWFQGGESSLNNLSLSVRALKSEKELVQTKLAEALAELDASRSQLKVSHLHSRGLFEWCMVRR